MECGGLISLIRHFTVPTIEVEQKELFWIPYQCLDLLLKLTKCLIQYLNKTLQEEIVTCLKNEIIKRFNNLSEKEIKDLDKEFLMKVLNDCKVILGGFLDNTTLYEIIENLELDLAYKFLVSQYFEKRLKGINSINEIAERIEFTQKYGRNNESFYINMPKISICKYLNSEIFLNWIKEKKIIEILLGDSIHIEILKRCILLY